MTARLFTLDPVEGFRPETFAGHKDIAIGAYFSADAKTVYTIGQDGAVFIWKVKPSDADSDDSDDEPIASSSNSHISALFLQIANTRRGAAKRHYFNQPGNKSCLQHVSQSIVPTSGGLIQRCLRAVGAPYFLKPAQT
ncbi:hypothetical protein AcV7_006932 [Taiwanofungus camphoratus]|nr:hypothetical protein AcV7_006932 [Antrodia cinnamomea]